jgi:hypothetical protein
MSMISERARWILRRTLSETQSAGLSFTVTPQLRYFRDRAMISWIRTAYLAAFALSGWRYILQPALQPIQDQLKHPSAVTLLLLSTYDPDGKPAVVSSGSSNSRPSTRACWPSQADTRSSCPSSTTPRSLGELARSLGARTGEPVRDAFQGRHAPMAIKTPALARSSSGHPRPRHGARPAHRLTRKVDLLESAA